jgi:diaminohydroxyphosphoribosylaminopyrimidine deaminase/5-amino-6-(5-phosphoribosylamino)uracil reductase
MNHETYIKRCIELAKKATGKTYPNPLVGAVIVHNDVIIGEGFHQKAGEAHAEINAINSVQNPELLPELQRIFSSFVVYNLIYSSGDFPEI